MSEAILLSVNPPYAGQIVSGIKRVEWRKAPLPTVKAYIYETKRGGGCGMVIGEAQITGSARFRNGDNIPPRLIKEGCVPAEKLKEYTEDNPVIAANYLQHGKGYDKPKTLSEFRGRKLAWRGNNHIHVYEELTRPPQSWCYVEELK